MLAIRLEAEHNAFKDGVEGFNKDKLNYAQTVEKNTLPEKKQNSSEISELFCFFLLFNQFHGGLGIFLNDLGMIQFILVKPFNSIIESIVKPPNNKKNWTCSCTGIKILQIINVFLF